MVPAADLAAFLGVTGEDAYLEELESSAVAEISALTGLHLEPRAEALEIHDGETYADRLDGSTARPQRVFLSQPPAGGLDDVTLVEERGGAADDWEEVELLDDGDPVFELDGRTLYRRIGDWPEGPRTIRITYVRGWDEPEDPEPEGYVAIPEDVRTLVRDLVAHRYRSGALRRLGGDVTGASIRGASFTIGSGPRGGSMETAGDMNMPANLALRMDRLPGSQSARRSRR